MFNTGDGRSPSAPSQVAEARPTRRRRLPGVNLKQGAVKQARLEAGLSLAQLGKGHVTAPAIYLIETARTRPSLPTLEHIARRTGKPVEYFLADPGGGFLSVSISGATATSSPSVPRTVLTASESRSVRRSRPANPGTTTGCRR